MTRDRIVTLLIGLAALIVAGAAAAVFQDNIVLFRIAPKTPFQVQAPPPAPQYGARGAWHLWPDKDANAGAVDVFYVHSTTYMSARRWNAPIAAGDAEAALKSRAAPNEAGPFLALGAVYGPRYRQATLFAELTQNFDGVAARRLAYEDVRRAFRHYLRTANPDRPILLAGYGQGGLHVQGLLKDFFQADDALRRRLVAAYVVGQATPLSMFDDVLAATPPCARPEDIRCVVSYADYEARFNEEVVRTRNRSMVFGPDGDLRTTQNDPLLCVNPLNFRPAPGYVPPDAHAGAASATGLRFGATPPQVQNAIGAECVEGVLITDRPAQAYLRRGAWFGEKWKPRHYNLFYFDLAENAAARVSAALGTRGEESMILEPISDAVDLEISPVNKVPTP